jgi:hypothetical protein
VKEVGPFWSGKSESVPSQGDLLSWPMYGHSGFWVVTRVDYGKDEWWMADVREELAELSEARAVVSLRANIDWPSHNVPDRLRFLCDALVKATAE